MEKTRTGCKAGKLDRGEKRKASLQKWARRDTGGREKKKVYRQGALNCVTEIVTNGLIHIGEKIKPGRKDGWPKIQEFRVKSKKTNTKARKRGVNILADEKKGRRQRTQIRKAINTKITSRKGVEG